MTDPLTSPKPVRPTWRQALVMLGGGTLLASSAWYGTIRAEGNDPVALTFAATFCAGMVLALVGVILVVVRAAKQPAVTDAVAISLAPRPTWAQALIMLASGAVLVGSSGYGFLETLGARGGNLFGPFATGFYIGCLVTLGGLIMLLMPEPETSTERWHSKPTVIQLAIMVASGLLLAGSSCSVFMGSIILSEGSRLAGFVGFLLGVVLTAWGLASLLIRIVKAVRRN